MPKRKTPDDFSISGTSKRLATDIVQSFPPTYDTPETASPLPPPPPPPLSIQAAHPELFQKLKDIHGRAPRFLFRAWHANSGGREGLNIKDAITSLAFFLDPHQLPFWHQTPDTITETSTTHLINGRTWRYPTLFSSWSQSLRVVLDYARTMPRGTAHVSVIDTHALDESNVVLWTPEMKVINPRIPQYFYNEFLVYGIVSGLTYKGVAVEILEKQNLWRDKLDDPLMAIPMAVPWASQIADEYGDTFQLAMTAYILAIHPYSFQKLADIVSMLAEKLAFPEDWFQDRKITSASWTWIRNYKDTTRALRILRNLVVYIKRKASDDDVKVPSKRKADPGDDELCNADELHDLITNFAGVSRELKKLHIDMIGWTPKESARWF